MDEPDNTESSDKNGKIHLLKIDSKGSKGMARSYSELKSGTFYSYGVPRCTDERGNTNNDYDTYSWV